MLIRRKFAELFALKTVEVHKDALHYTTQPIRWSYKEVNRHSQAYARGLLEMGLKPGDTLSTWITCPEASESNIIHLACYLAGLKLLPFSSAADLPTALSSSSALIFSPWEKHNSEYRIDHILSSIPQLLQTPAGSLPTSQFKTKYFIQTGFKTIRGTYKLKTIPVYSGKPVSNPGFSLQFNGKMVTNEALQVFLKHFVEGVGKGVVVNSLPSKTPLAIGSLLGNLVSGNKVVNAVMSDSAEVVNANQATVLVTCEEKVAAIKEGCSVEKLVLSAENKEEVERVVKGLEKKGVRAKSVIAYNRDDLSNLG